MARYGRGTSLEDPDRKVYVGNLPSGASRTEIEEAFCRYGRVKNVWVARNPPGFAFVFFEDKHDALDAVEALDERHLCGVRVRVEMSSGETRRSRDRYRGGGGGGGYMGRRRQTRENERCYECGQRGHFARDCDRRGRSPGGYRRGRSPGGYRSRRYSRSLSRSRSRSPGRRVSRSPVRRVSRSPVRRGSRSPVRYRSHSRSRSRSRS